MPSGFGHAIGLPWMEHSGLMLTPFQPAILQILHEERKATSTARPQEARPASQRPAPADLQSLRSVRPSSLPSLSPLPPTTPTTPPQLTPPPSRDTHALTTLCGSGLLSTFRARLSHRPPSTSVTWTLSRYLSRPRLVSHRTAPLPFPGFPETALRQAIVKIRSVQILTTRSDAQARKVLAEKLAAAEEDEEGDGKGAGGARKLSPELRRLRLEQARARVAPHAVSALGASRVAAATTTAEGELEGGTRVEREVTEFVVLQRLMVKGVEGPWMVWGFGEETTLEGMREEDKRVKAMQEFEAAQNAGV